MRLIDRCTFLDFLDFLSVCLFWLSCSRIVFIFPVSIIFLFRRHRDSNLIFALLFVKLSKWIMNIFLLPDKETKNRSLLKNRKKIISFHFIRLQTDKQTTNCFVFIWFQKKNSNHNKTLKIFSFTFYSNIHFLSFFHSLSLSLSLYSIEKWTILLNKTPTNQPTKHTHAIIIHLILYNLNLYICSANRK